MKKLERVHINRNARIAKRIFCRTRKKFAVILYVLQEFLTKLCKKSAARRALSVNVKHAPVFLMIIPMIFCGCRDKSPTADNPPQADAFTVSVNIDCEDVYGIHIEYLLGGEAMGGKSQVYANGGVLTRGEELIFSFLPEDFKNPEELSEKPLQIEFYAITENERECLISGKEPNERFIFSENHWEWNAYFGERYEFTLESDNNGGYVLFPAR